MKAPKSLCIALLIGVWQADAQTKTATLVANSESIMLHPASGTDSTFGPVVTYLTTYDGSTTTFPQNQQVGAGLIQFSGELRPRRGSAGTYETDYAVYSSTFGFVQYGSVIVTLPITDTDQNGLPDFAQVDKAANVTGNAVLQVDSPVSGSANLSMAFTRSSGSILGNVHISATRPGVTFGTPNATWEVISYSGSFSYTRGAQNFTTISVSRTTGQGTTISFTGQTPFTVINQNQIALPQFFATGVSGANNATVSVLPSTLNRVGKKYLGKVQLTDGGISTSWADFTDWVFEIVDTNDADGNGVPDLSDNLATPPTITLQPVSLTVNFGKSVSFKVAATGSPAPSLQWRKNGVNISGATSSTYSIGTVSAADAGNYDCVASNLAGSATSAAATLSVNSAPVLTTQPVSVTVNPGAPVSFIVTANGVPAPTYQWRRNGVNISGATGATYTIASAKTTDSGNYDCVVSNSAGSVMSSIATLSVYVAPSITSQPLSKSVNLGDAVTFAVAATGSAPLTYQWRKNGQDLSGATNAILTLATVTATDAGTYTVVVSNSAGTAISSLASLQVFSPSAIAPVFNIEPSDQTVPLGTSVAFSASVSGTAPFYYQWKKDGVDVTGAKSNTFILASASFADSGLYSLFVSNSAGTATSRAAVLKVMLPTNDVPTITVSDAAMLEGNSGTTPMSFTVALSSPSSRVVTVFYATSDGSAIAPEDYLSTSGSLTFAPGITNLTIVVEVVGDTRKEPDEVFWLNITGSLNAATTSRSQFAGVILNDDLNEGHSGPVIRINPPKNGVAQLSVTSTAGHDVTIQMSSDLIDWLPLITLPTPNGSVEFGDPTLATTKQKFYRAVSQ